ncbi:MAG: prepilin-type N-terminal cleavage/methylation domain-containing protein [Deltaproteobacteria bacterium]|nr:prepilin-type N-terminal cleavage/methylation domain-containing protein [Deltaproteobacteria bacterium]
MARWWSSSSSGPGSCPAVRRRASGFTLTEVVVSLAILVILAGVAVPLVLQVLGSQRDTGVQAQLLNLKKAIIGEPRTTQPGQKRPTRYGYVGDMGGLPASLDDLITKGSQASPSFNSDLQIGAGWKGPYIDGPGGGRLLDPWGRSFIYNSLPCSTPPYTHPTTGATVVACIKSLGADGAAGTADDLTVEIYKGDVRATVLGIVKDTTQTPVFAATVKLTYPLNGALTTATQTTDSEGSYMFEEIPLGERVVQIDARLLYVTNTALTTGAAKDNVEFTMQNFSKDAITVNSFKAVYTSTPQAYYDQLWINGVKVFDSATPRAGSGDTKTFSNTSVAGTGVIQESLRVGINLGVVQLPEFVVGTLGTGGQLKVEMKNFKDAASGAGSAVDMTGVIFEVTFSDGSKALFTTKRGT